MTEDRALELMELAISMIREELPEDMYVDDVAWGTDCFRIPIWRDGRDPGSSRHVYTFSFSYDPDDIWERTDKQQVIDEVRDFLGVRV